MNKPIQARSLEASITTRRFSARIVLAACVVLALVGYAIALEGYFLSDDAMIGLVRQQDGRIDWAHVAKTFASDWRCFPGAETTYFRPLVIVTQAIDARLWGLCPFGFHFTNVFLHGVVGFLLWRVALLVGASLPAALFAAGLFVLHPLHPESVAWISGRTDIVAAVPTLGSIAAFLAYRRSGKLRLLVASLALYVLALLAKEPAIAGPAMIAALDLSLPRKPPERNPLSETVRPLLAFGVLTVCYLLWRVRSLGDVYGGVRPQLLGAPGRDLAQVWHDLGNNLGMFFFPFNRELGNRDMLTWGLSVAVVGIGTAFVLNVVSGHVPWRRMGAVCLAFVASLLPVASMMRIQDNLNSSRLWYLPICWVCLFVALGCFQRARAWSFGVVLGQLTAALVVLRMNLVPWKDAGETIARIRTVYGETFGAYTGERIDNLPRIDRGAYLALWNAELFGRPFVDRAPRLDERARLSAAYNPSRRTLEIFEDDAWQATEHLRRDVDNAVWIWDVDGAPLKDATLRNCVAVGESAGAEADGSARFDATSTDPWLELEADREIAPPESEGQRETAYLLVTPPTDPPPQMFWRTKEHEHWTGARSALFRPELAVIDGQVTQRLVDGYAVYAIRLDRHPNWPGVHAIRGIRLDPATKTGPFSILYFNVSRELHGLR